jgi:hypothetical protein
LKFYGELHPYVLKEKIMKTSTLLKAVPIAALALSVYSTGAVAGATNRDPNTAATPGPKATTTTTPADPATGREDMRRGTTRTENMDTPQSAGDVGSGSAGGTGAHDKSMKHKKDKSMSGSSGGSGEYKGYRTPNSTANPGEGSTPENADSGYDLSTGNTSGSSTGQPASQQ